MSNKQTFTTIDPSTSDVRKVYSYLVAGVSPRPIALVSTISENGVNNLAPFSFFNAFGANPPVVGFSPARRGRDGTFKDTLLNLQKLGECVVQSVSYGMVQQVSLASTEYEPEVDEFVKSGLTPIDSDSVKPKRVAESPFQMECKVQQIIELGTGGISGNLVVCEVLKFHISDAVMKDGVIDPNLIDLVGRNSANYYTRASQSALFEVEKPVARKGIGVDALPQHIRESHILSANNLGQLGNIETLPSETEIAEFLKAYQLEGAIPEDLDSLDENDYKKHFAVGAALADSNPAKSKELIERSAKRALQENDVEFAIRALMVEEDS